MTIRRHLSNIKFLAKKCSKINFGNIKLKGKDFREINNLKRATKFLLTKNSKKWGKRKDQISLCKIQSCMPFPGYKYVAPNAKNMYGIFYITEEVNIRFGFYHTKVLKFTTKKSLV
jgi:hypothetical protein